MNVRELIEQLLNYDPELPVRIAPLTKIDDYECYVGPKTVEISKIFNQVDKIKKTDILLIGFAGDEFPEFFE